MAQNIRAWKAEMARRYPARGGAIAVVMVLTTPYDARMTPSSIAFRPNSSEKRQQHHEVTQQDNDDEGDLRKMLGVVVRIYMGKSGFGNESVFQNLVRTSIASQCISSRLYRGSNMPTLMGPDQNT